MACKEFGMGIAPDCGQMRRCIDDDQTAGQSGLAQPCGEPI
jgi:hypothetical protein